MKVVISIAAVWLLAALVAVGPAHASVHTAKKKMRQYGRPAEMYAAGELPRDCINHPWPHNNTLLPGETLYRGGYLESANAILDFQSFEGNVVLLRKPEMTVLWNSSTTNMSAHALHLHTDGNLVIFDTEYATIWESGTNNGTILVVEDNCQMALYAKAPLESVAWRSNKAMCITAHVVMHSHDDVGWLILPEEYADGCGAPHGGTDGIFTTMMQALSDNPERKFSEVEMYFFQRWWKKQNETVQATTRKLVERGQLAFINAGWSMHDEACVHQESAIANMEVGNQFLRDTFGETMNVTIGWHIDPFGHASTTPRIMSQMGFDAFFFQRQDYQQREYMMRTKQVETMWNPSPNLGPSAQMFTSIMFNGYCFGCQNTITKPWFIMCPSPFFSMDCIAKTPWLTGSQAIFEEIRQRPTDKGGFNQSPRTVTPDEARNLGYPPWLPPVQELAQGYVDSLRSYEESFRTGHILVPWGCDFQHENAHLSFQLMDAVLAEVNNNASYGMKLKYTHPHEYIKAVKDMNYKWPRNDHDYFLDSDNGQSYWSGYLSSRAEYKGYERHMMAERVAAELALSASGFGGTNLDNQLARLYTLRQAMGIAQHHDSITGTERVNVRDQYQFLISRAGANADQAVSDVFANSTGIPVHHCVLANLSQCTPTYDLKFKKNISAYIFNPLARQRLEYVTIPVPATEVTVVRINGDGTESLVVSEVTPTWDLTTTRDMTSPPVDWHQHQVIFPVNQSALELTEYVLMPTSTEGYSYYVTPVPVSSGEAVTISNGHYTASFDPDTHFLSEISNSESGLASPVKQNIMHYCPHNDTYMHWPHVVSTQASGAYIFRTCEFNQKAEAYAQAASGVSVLKGPLCEEIRMFVDNASNINQHFRVCRDMNYVDLLAGIGEVEMLQWGAEIIMRFSTDIQTKNVWYTDSEALEMQKRVTNERPNYPYTLTEPVSSNFFPCNAFSLINSTVNSSYNLAIAADRSRATASLKEGEIEFLVQRRLMFDDARGVAQNLNETTRVLTRNRIVLNSDNVAYDMRLNSLLMTHKPIVRLGGKASIPGPYAKFTLAGTLPPQVHLHTRTILSEGKLLVRLQHLFASNEPGSKGMGVPAKADITAVLPPGMKMDSVEEYDMNGVRPLHTIERQDFLTCNPETGIATPVPQVPPSLVPGTTDVILQPTDIRTFIVKYHY